MQVGEPSTLAVNQDTTCDLPFQIYDINNDGYDEVILPEIKVMILDVAQHGYALQRRPGG